MTKLTRHFLALLAALAVLPTAWQAVVETQSRIQPSASVSANVSGVDGAIIDGDGVTRLDVLDLTNSNPAAVAIVDASGTQITSFGGGTQYTQDAALTVATTIGTMSMGRASAAAPTGVSADGDAVLPWYLRSGAQATVLTAGGVLIGGDDTNGLDVDVTRINGTVTVSATDLDVQSGGADILSTTAFNAAFGTAGTADSQVMSIQGIASMTPIQVADNGTTLSVDDGGGSITIDGSITCSNCSGSGASKVDDAAFTIATDSVAPAGFLLDDTSTDSVDEGDVGLARMSANRVQYQIIRDGASGAERGVSVTANNELLVELGAGSASIGILGANSGVDIGDVTINNASGASAVNIQDGGNSITVDGSISCSNCSGSGASDVEGSTYTLGTDSVAPLGGYRDDTSPTTLTEDRIGLARLTQYRALHVNLRDASGNELALSSDSTEDAAIATGGPQIMLRAKDFDGAALPGVVSAEGDAVSAAASLYGVQYVMLTGEDGSTQIGTSTTPMVVGDGSGALNVICDSGCGGGTTYTHDTAMGTVTSVTAPTLMGRASAGAPTDVSADGDAVVPWFLRSGAQAVQMTLSGTLTNAGNGTATSGTQRFTLASDSTGNIATIGTSVTPGTSAAHLGKAEDAAHASGDTGVSFLSRRIDAAASSATTDADYATVNTDANGLLWSRQLDPCTGVAKTSIPINISTATTTELTPSLAGASNNYYVCSIDLVVGGANNVALVDDDTDNCASVTAGMAGGTTAGSGWNFAANGGLTKGNGASTVFKTNGTNRVVCLVTSAAVQVSGSIQVVAAP